ncbi:MAG TPA: hypothetical protein VK447_06045 [Myxococcaceae bacterium]|jgi:ElaB/YqjD/DUF883 family membrane-anchored ribosome-binding protein|nr:hypothetical protein [Myxococcaceae bacterium]
MDASQQLQDRAREMQARLAPQIDEARQNLMDFNDRAIRFIKERPGTCLLGALAFGFIVGKIASRR